jgi:hypothetical protein
MVSITLRVMSRPDVNHLATIYQTLGLDYDERVCRKGFNFTQFICLLRDVRCFLQSEMKCSRALSRNLMLLS